MSDKDAPGFEFPVDFPVKAMGRADDSFEATVVEVLSRHVPAEDLKKVSTRPSRNGTYSSVTCTIVARSREQLDAIYDALTEHPDVLMRL